MPRKRGLVAALFGMSLIYIPSTYAAEPAFQTSVPSVLLIDADTGSVLFEKNADVPSIPASTLKIMTAELVFREIKEGRLTLDTEFTVSEHAWRTGGAMSSGSKMFAALHSHIRVEDLIKGLVIDSGNDAAIVLAEGVSGSEREFAQKMNDRARELGLLHLSFKNPWGMDDPDQRVTAREMALLADHVIKNYPEFYRYFAEREFTWSKIRQQNLNPLLTMDIGADGLKTGNINEASGFGLVGSAVQNGQRLILAMYGAKSSKERAEEARKILTWGFHSFEMRTIFSAGTIVGTARVFGGASSEVPLVTRRPVRILMQRNTGERVTGLIVYTGPLMAPVSEGAEHGRLRIFRGSTLAIDVPLESAADVATGSLTQRALDSALELGRSLFRRYIFKQAT